MLIIDANIWVAASVYDDVTHRQSSRWLREVTMRGEHIAAPRILLVEVTSALERTGRSQYRVPLERRIQSVRMRWVPVDDTLIDRAIDLASHLKLKALDCLYVATAELLNVPLVTWDAQVIECAASRIKVYRPM